jgi:hypothetical protein
MRGSIGTVVVGLFLAASAAPCHAAAVAVGEPMPLSMHALGLRMHRNPELRSLIEFRGYPDWAEEVEVASELPLGTHEVRVYYLRLDREIGFTEAYILGQPDIGLRLYERPLTPAMRRRIERALLAHDPARRAELAADRALAAADRAERGADMVEMAADRAERFVDDMERAFFERLRK